MNENRDDDGRPQAIADVLDARAKTWPEAITPVSRMMVQVFRLSDLVVKQATATVEQQGLGFSEFEALATLRSFPAPHELTPGDLASAMLISSGGLTKVLHALEQKGLVARSADSADRRSKPVRLTAKGRNAAERAMAGILAVDNALVAGALTKHDVAELTRLTGKLLERLESPLTDGES